MLGGRESNMRADGMERVYFGLVQIALFTNKIKKSRQEILGFPALAYVAHKISKSTEKHIYKTKAFRGRTLLFLYQ